MAPQNDLFGLVLKKKLVKLSVKEIMSQRLSFMNV